MARAALYALTGSFVKWSSTHLGFDNAVAVNQLGRIISFDEPYAELTGEIAVTNFAPERASAVLENTIEPHVDLWNEGRLEKSMSIYLRFLADEGVWREPRGLRRDTGLSRRRIVRTDKHP